MASIAFNNYRQYAKVLEHETGIKYDAKPYKETIRKMLDGYCKAMDEQDDHMATLYISGLMLRHWDKGKKLAETCPNIGMQGEDFMDWVYDAIMLACEYRKWQKDETVNAQQCINQCIETIRVRRYYDMGLDKHKANNMTVSLETPVGDEGDNGSQRVLADTIIDENAEQEAKMADATSSVRHIIQGFIDKQHLVEAIILDIIAFGDTEKVSKQTHKGTNEAGETYKYTSYSRSFWKYKAIQILANLPENYQEYFLDNYNVKLNALIPAIDLLRRANNQKLSKELTNTLRYAKGVVGRMQ